MLAQVLRQIPHRPVRLPRPAQLGRRLAGDHHDPGLSLSAVLPERRVMRAIPSSAALSMFRAPAAAPNTIRARYAACWLLVRARTRRCHSFRSSTVSTIGVARRLIPRLLARPDHRSLKKCATTTLLRSNLSGTVH